MGQLVGIQADPSFLTIVFMIKSIFFFGKVAINKLKDFFMSFVTYFMHLVFVNIPSFFRTDLVLYILPILSVSILLFSLRIMFYQAPKLRRVK